MSKIFLNEFKIKRPKYILKAEKRKNFDFINSTTKKIVKILNIEKPNVVIVQGDTNTSLSGALAVKGNQSKKGKRIFLAHIEMV